MISVILAILKIIGIVLLCLLGLLLLIILAVLLVPIRYQAAGSAAEKEIHARAGISWLLHLIQVKLELVNQKAGITVKLFGIPIRRMGTLFESAENEENPDSGNSSRKTDSEETGKNAESQRTDSNSETRIPKISDEVLESLPMEKNVLSEERKADRTQPAVRTVNRQKESTSKSEEEQKPQKEKNPESAAEAKKAEKAQRNTDRGRQRAERTKQKEEHAKRKEAQKEQERYSRKKKSAGAERNRGRSWKISWIRFRIRRTREPSAWFARRPKSFYFIFCRPGFRYRQGSDSLIRRRPACSSVLFMRSIRSIRIISV